GVGRAAEPMALRLELAPQLAVVVDLAVVDEPERAVVARERLEARVGEVDDREPAEAERDALRRVTAVAVRPAVVELRGHSLDGLGLGRPPERHDPADPAHVANDRSRGFGNREGRPRARGSRPSGYRRRPALLK